MFSSDIYIYISLFNQAIEWLAHKNLSHLNSVLTFDAHGLAIANA
jgi:hypothetical protein